MIAEDLSFDERKNDFCEGDPSPQNQVGGKPQRWRKRIFHPRGEFFYVAKDKGKQLTQEGKVIMMLVSLSEDNYLIVPFSSL
jgi:hypothetical protein